MRLFGVDVVAGEIHAVSGQPRSEPKFEFPLIKGYEHKVNVNPNVTPCRQPLRRLPFAIRQEVSDHLLALENKEVIERVEASPWVSPVVVGRKKNGAIRLCVDLRKANRAVVCDGFPLPHIEETLHRLRDSKWFSVIDLENAYHQVPLHPDSRNLTCFVTEEGLFRYTR